MLEIEIDTEFLKHFEAKAIPASTPVHNAKSGPQTMTYQLDQSESVAPPQMIMSSIFVVPRVESL